MSNTVYLFVSFVLLLITLYQQNKIHNLERALFENIISTFKNSLAIEVMIKKFDEIDSKAKSDKITTKTPPKKETLTD